MQINLLNETDQTSIWLHDFTFVTDQLTWPTSTHEMIINPDHVTFKSDFLHGGVMANWFAHRDPTNLLLNNKPSAVLRNAHLELLKRGECEKWRFDLKSQVEQYSMQAAKGIHS